MTDKKDDTGKSKPDKPKKDKLKKVLKDHGSKLTDAQIDAYDIEEDIGFQNLCKISVGVSDNEYNKAKSQI